jgi:hypothetical protein
MKYKVTLPFIIYVTTTVEADSEDIAIDEAIENVQLTNYCGNGGDDRMVGSYDTCDTIEPGEFIDDASYQPSVELV